MSGTEDDQPITEEEFARMLGEEDAARANGAEAAHGARAGAGV